MSDVKIAPKQRSFCENFDRIFKKPRTPLIAPDSTGRASSAPREAAKHDAGKDGSPAGLIRQPSEFDSPTRYQHITDPNGPRLAFTVANSFTGDWFGFVL